MPTARSPQAQLEAWRDGRPGFFSLLAELTIHGEAPLEARWLAAVYFKNNVKKAWRATGVGDEEKEHL